MIYVLILLLVAYLIGSIPTAYIYGLFKGIDIRKEGSGNVGATNLGRVLGKKAFFIVLFLDALKGFVPVFIFLRLSPEKISNNEFFAILVFSSSIIGHVYSIFLKFKGGKGVATSLGGIIALIPVASLGAILIFVLTFLFSKIVSLSSIIAAISLPLFVFYFSFSNVYFAFSFILSIFIIYTHRSNIKRLIKGSELKINSKREK